jgi:preprotein translocase subunit SecD
MCLRESGEELPQRYDIGMSRFLSAAFLLLLALGACSTPPMTKRPAPPMLEFRLEAVTEEYDNPGVAVQQIHGENVYLLPGKRFLVERAWTEDIGSGRTGVHFVIYPEQVSSFRIWTGQNIGRRVAIVHKNQPLSLFKLSMALPGEGIISGGRGGLSKIEAERIAEELSRD